MISPVCTGDPPYPIEIKLRNADVIHDVVKYAKFGVDRWIGVGSAGSGNFALPLQKRHDL
jgi:hypothetical protein